MPKMNGIELLSRIKIHEKWRRIPVIMVSGLKETDAVRGKTVAAIITGGNVDADIFTAVLQGHTPEA